MLFLNDNKVAVIISGIISVNSYKENILNPKELCLLVPGNILGFDEISNNRTSHFDHWLVSQTEIELAYFDKTFFKV